MIGGWLWQTVNPQFPFVVTIVVCVLSVIPVWFKFKIPKPTETSEQIEESAS
jgi:hypothetical protein